MHLDTCTRYAHGIHTCIMSELRHIHVHTCTQSIHIPYKHIYSCIRIYTDVHSSISLEIFSDIHHRRVVYAITKYSSRV